MTGMFNRFTIWNYLFVGVFMFFSIGMFLFVMRPDGIHGIIGSLIGAIGCGTIAALNILELLEDARHRQPITEAEYEAQEKARLLKLPEHQRTLWCQFCGNIIDPCDYPTPKEGVEAHERHVEECRRASEASAEEEGGI